MGGWGRTGTDAEHWWMSPQHRPFRGLAGTEQDAWSARPRPPPCSSANCTTTGNRTQRCTLTPPADYKTAAPTKDAGPLSLCGKWPRFENTENIYPSCLANGSGFSAGSNNTTIGIAYS